MWLIEQLYIELGPIPFYLSELDCSNSPVWNIEFDELENWKNPVQIDRGIGTYQLRFCLFLINGQIISEQNCGVLDFPKKQRK